jgi:hypothetical protein
MVNHPSRSITLIGGSTAITTPFPTQRLLPEIVRRRFRRVRGHTDLTQHRHEVIGTQHLSFDNLPPLAPTRGQPNRRKPAVDPERHFKGPLYIAQPKVLLPVRKPRSATPKRTIGS